jgi:4'-phosphopantetheinyl transferase
MGLAGSLQYDEAHVWQVKLDNPIWDMFATVLNAAELEKAARYRTSTLQQRYRRCRSALRLILARYANQAAPDLNFRYGQFGKPELLDHHRLHFNLSHSGDHALIAISTHELGVDLEFMGKQNVDLDGLIDMVCHPNEKAALLLLQENAKNQQFYRLWTQKEAYCKMQGLGLQQSLPALHFKATESGDVLQVHVDDRDHASAHFVHKLDLLEGYAASICLPLESVRISTFSA